MNKNKYHLPTHRQNSPLAETLLWHHLRASRLEAHKFRRQYLIRPFIVDFICVKEKLIIELDGGQHAEAVEYDVKRTKFIESKGYRVLRFWNNEVMGNLSGVLETIWRALSK